MSEEKKSENKEPRVVKGMESVKLTEQEFRNRFLERFYDPAFDAVSNELGYYQPYATSHDDLDQDEALQLEVRNQTQALVQMVR